jgi:hypothetical protein
MTLEQINNRQEQLNARLAECVITSNQVISHITGECSVKDIRKETPYPSGLLNELSFLQDRNEILIQELGEVLRTLTPRIYSQTEPSVNMAVKVQY